MVIDPHVRGLIRLAAGPVVGEIVREAGQIGHWVQRHQIHSSRIPTATWNDVALKRQSGG